jgi:1-phosphofructokinase
LKKDMPMIRTVCLNPALDKTALIAGFQVDHVNRIVSLRRDAGGKGINVSKVVSKLGGKTCAYALLGGTVGTQIESDIVDMGISCVSVAIEGDTRTNLKIIDTQSGTHTDINEPGPVVDSQELLDLLQRLTADIEEGRCRGALGQPPERRALRHLCHLDPCQQAGGSSSLPRYGWQSAHRGIDAAPTLVKPNLQELSDLVGQELHTTEDIIAAAHELLSAGIKTVVVSMGPQGALFCTKEHTISARAPHVPVGSTVGAGDAVLAAIAFAWERGYRLSDAATLAIATGSANVMQSGTQAAERSVVESLLSKVDLHAL